MALRVTLAVLMLLGVAGFVGGQGAVGYDPEIGTVSDGVVNDVQVTVSADRRYVQINFFSGMAIIIDIDDFVVITD